MCAPPGSAARRGVEGYTGISFTAKATGNFEKGSLLPKPGVPIIPESQKLQLKWHRKSSLSLLVAPGQADNRNWFCALLRVLNSVFCIQITQGCFSLELYKLFYCAVGMWQVDLRACQSYEGFPSSSTNLMQAFLLAWYPNQYKSCDYTENPAFQNHSRFLFMRVSPTSQNCHHLRVCLWCDNWGQRCLLARLNPAVRTCLPWCSSGSSFSAGTWLLHVLWPHCQWAVCTVWKQGHCSLWKPAVWYSVALGLPRADVYMGPRKRLFRHLLVTVMQISFFSKGTQMGLSETLTCGAHLEDCHGRAGNNESPERIRDYKGWLRTP